MQGGLCGAICKFSLIPFEGIFDVRQHALLQSLPVHSGAINSIVVNDVDGYFITGSSEGDIKVRLINCRRQIIVSFL